MRLVFQRPVWLEFTAFTAAMLGFLGHILGLWRLVAGGGLQLKIRILDFLIWLFQMILDEDSWLLYNLKVTDYTLKRFLFLPQWYQAWYFISGILEFLISSALFVVAILLWHKKTYSVRFFYIVICLSIGVHVLNIASSMMISESMGIMKSVMDVPVVILKASLIPIVYFADKSILGTHAKEKVHFKPKPSLQELTQGRG